mmetsp:Transcript_6781/g.19848  ORF Transcript_6781/g.19848 Transcript_6781/m.19848 type:complete len:204 (+) Transcript_6781:1063-1674(+)
MYHHRRVLHLLIFFYRDALKAYSGLFSPTRRPLRLPPGTLKSLSLLRTAPVDVPSLARAQEREHNVHVSVLVLHRVALQHLENLFLVALPRLLYYDVHDLALDVLLQLPALVAPLLQPVVQYPVLRLQHHDVVEPPLREEIASVVVHDVPSLRHALLQEVANLVLIQDIALQVRVPTVVQVMVFHESSYLDVAVPRLFRQDGR